MAPFYSIAMSDDDITLTPEYEFNFDNNEDRNSLDIEEIEKYPEAAEMLAQLGREDPDCSVQLLGFAN